MRRRDEQVHGGDQIAVQDVREARVGLRGEAGQGQRLVPAGRQFGVADHVPQRLLALGARHRGLDVVGAGGHRGQRVRVQPGGGEGEIVVVDQDQARARHADEAGHVGAFAHHVHLDPTHPVPVVQADGHAVRTQHRPLRRGLLDDGEPGERAVVVHCVLGAQGVVSGGLQPQRRPGGQVAAGVVFENGEQVGEGGVAPRVAVEEVPHRRDERVLADPRDELSDDGRALGVGDAVVVEVHVVKVADVGDHRVGGRQGILAEPPRLAVDGEGDRGVRPVRGRRLAA